MATGGKPKLEKRLSFQSEAFSTLTQDRVCMAALRPNLVAGVLSFDELPEIGALRAVLSERLLKLPRFSQCFVDDGKEVKLGNATVG